MSDSLQPHEPQHARPPCPSPTPGVHLNPCPLSRWCHSTILSSVIPFFSCPQSFPASGSFLMSQLFLPLIHLSIPLFFWSRDHWYLTAWGQYPKPPMLNGQLYAHRTTFLWYWVRVQKIPGMCAVDETLKLDWGTDFGIIFLKMASKAMKVDSFLEFCRKEVLWKTLISRKRVEVHLGQVSIDLKPHNWKWFGHLPIQSK